MPALPTQSELLALLSEADSTEAVVVRQVALRTGLLWSCPGHGDHHHTQHQCPVCDARPYIHAALARPEAVSLAAIRSNLNVACSDAEGDARFVVACQISSCGPAAAAAANYALRRGQCLAASAVANRIIAAVETGRWNAAGEWLG